VLAGAITGKHRFVRWVLAPSVYEPWAKVSFMCYLLQSLVIMFYYIQQRKAFLMEPLDLIFIFLSCSFFSFMAAVPACLMLEAPFLQLEKVFLFPAKKKERQLSYKEVHDLQGDTGSDEASNTSTASFGSLRQE
jgi:peptidoglycan/LPS O-acetylase OafA/YrhL